MPDMMQFLRMRNIFGSQPPVPGGSINPLIGNDMPDQGGFFGMGAGPTNPDTGAISASAIPAGLPSAAAPPAQDTMPDMASMFNPHYEAEKAYSDLASRYPKREDYKPSVLRRIGGALMAFSGGMAPGRGLDFYHANPNAIQGGISFMDKPFTDAQEDWAKQIGPAQQAATFERYQNANERQAAYQTAQSKINEQRERDTAANNQRKSENAEARTAIYKFKAEHPNEQIKAVKGGNFLSFDPATKKWTDSGISTGTFSDAERMEQEQEYTRENIGSKGAEAANVAGINAKSREKIQSEKGWTIGTIPDPDDPTKQIGVRVNADTGEVHPITFGGKGVSGFAKSGTGAGGGKPETPQATRIRQFNAARELYNTNPQLRPYIKLGSPGSNDFTITPPSEGFFGHSGPKQSDYEAMQQAIYGAAAPKASAMASHAPTTPNAASPKAAAPTNAPPAPKGWKYVPKPGGGWTAVKDTGTP